MPKQHHWAVVIGIDQYPGGFPPLSCAQRDAEAFHQWVCDSEGGDVPSGQAELVHLQLTAAGITATNEPTLDRVFDTLERAFTSAMQAMENDPAGWQDSRLYVYLSGHGVAPSVSDSALLTANSSPRSLGKHVSCDALKEFLLETRVFRDLVIFADCCRDNIQSKVKTCNVPWTIFPQFGDNSTRYLIAFAAEFSQKAYEEQSGPQNERRGYFTRCLLETLNNRSMPGAQITGDNLRKRMKGLLANLSKQPGAPPVGLRLEAPSLNDDELFFGVTTETPSYRIRLEAPAQASDIRFLPQNSPPLIFQKAPAQNFVDAHVPMGVYEVEYSVDGGATYKPATEPVTVVPGYNEIRVV